VRRIASPAAPVAAECDIETWLIDLDNTIYPAHVDLFPQFAIRVRDYIVGLLKISPDEATALHSRILAEYGNSLRGLMGRYQCQPLEFLEHIHDIDLSMIESSPTLDGLLGRLPGRKLIFTSGSAAHAERVMRRLGVRHHFDNTFDIIAAGFAAKADPVVNASLIKSFGIDPARTAMIDDVEANLLPAHELGMRTIWIRREAGRQPSASRVHIHHESDDLIRFLQGWLKI